MNIVAKYNQTLIDIAMQLYGNASSAYALARENGLSVTADIAAGTVLSATGITELNAAMKQYFDVAAISPATYYVAPAPFDHRIVVFAYPGNYDNFIDAVIADEQAGSYLNEQLNSALTVEYTLNGSTVALPFTLTVGDELRVAITRLDEAVDASIKIATYD